MTVCGQESTGIWPAPVPCASAARPTTPARSSAGAALASNRRPLMSRSLLEAPAARLHAVRHDLAVPELRALCERPLIDRPAGGEVRVPDRAVCGDSLARPLVDVVR